MKITPLAILPPAIFLVIAGMFAWGMYRENPNDLPLALAGQTVPPLVLDAMDGRAEFTSEDLKGPGVKLVNFWASWCAPCRAEHPALTGLSEAGVRIYGVNYKDKPVAAARFLDELGDPYTAIGADTNGRNGLNWGVVAMPETFLIDGQGNIVLRHAGPLTEKVLENVIRPALEQHGS